MDSREKINDQIDNYYDLWFKTNDIYSDWAKRHNIQENVLFALYVINSAVPYCTQSQICNKLYLPKQTVSQILSGLEKDGYISKETNAEDRRNKIIKFTEKGERFATRILEELKVAEIEAFSQLSEKQRSTIIESFALLNSVLIKSFSK
ncbi:MarR family winged helix-turn-helix transcriptional regulator [Clostridium scatologenes]|uniref:MarR family transcriptional regulator n=1 Tax=Clostridium scatologenes TaxID=1548 RepID=A0A0E3JNJ5_CLOSL|nr:MarR family transcriptional regulator [Clostridium scatologenes]AKA69348.1 MarR family transcriptional regulator [Clostridium scatologenes]